MRLRVKDLPAYNFPVLRDESGVFVDFVVPGVAMVIDCLEIPLGQYSKVQSNYEELVLTAWAINEN